ncbi:acyl carrier protein [Vibrio phage 1.187.O._10N.286.49.F1]|nr:acyl carrier protein [Vibrio phage 1.187.O._10N.286.49.F1]
MHNVNIFGWNIYKKPEAEVKQTKYLRVCKVCEDLLGIPDGVILSETTTKDDLWMDSLDEMELLMAVEREFDIDISDEQWEICQNIGDVVTLVEGLV